MGEININGNIFIFQDIELTYENATNIDPSISKINSLDLKKILDDQS